MVEMVVLKYDIGSNEVTVLCPVCARISHQVLKQDFNIDHNNEFLAEHICPICGSVYQYCSPFRAYAWKTAYSRYLINHPAVYNIAVKEQYNRRKLKTQETQNQVEQVISDSLSTQQNMPTVTSSTGEEGKMRKMELLNSDNNLLCEQEEREERVRVSSTSGKLDSVFGLTSDSILTNDTENNSQKVSSVPNKIGTEDSVQPKMLMERKIERWKRELLDTSKRNKMINYRETKRSTLKILDPGATELFNLLAINEKTLTFQRPITKDSDFRTYSILALMETLSYPFSVHKGDIKAEGTVLEREKTLRNLRSKTKLAQEEQGTNILYLSFGFILWREHNGSNTPWVKSPLLMMPVQLGLKSLNASFTLSKHDDEIVVNPTLDYLFNQNYGIVLPTFELKNKDSFDNYLKTIEEIIDKKGWKLVREVNLGLLSFLKISMYHDLNNNRERMLNNPVIQVICGDRYALGELPEKAYNFNFDRTQPTEWHEVVDSDSSQEEAILLSKLGISFVMQGPPGTGKSQTITNIIAEALGEGKKVLFVSEKSAALQVVLKRLKEAGLDDFCLSLHNYKVNRKEIIESIGANLRLDREYVDSSIMSDLTELFHDRQYLNEYAEDLHKIIEPFGESIYMVFGKLAKLSDASIVDFKLENPTQISREKYLSLLYVIDAFEKALHSMDGKLSDNPWAETRAVSSGQGFRTEMVNASEGLPEALNELETLILSINNEYGISIGTAWDSSIRGIDRIEQVLCLPLFPVKWQDAGYRKMLRERAIREEKIDQAEQGHAKTLGELVQKIEEEWEVTSLGLTTDYLKEVFDERTYWTGSDKPEYMADCNNIAIQSLENIIDVIEKIANHYKKAREMLKVFQKDYPSAILMVSRILNTLSDAPEMASEWFDVRKNSEYANHIEEIKSHRDAVKQKENQLLETWEPGVLEIDADGMLARFKTEYTGMFHKMKSTYKEDMRQIKLLSRKVGFRIEEPEVITLLQKVVDYKTEKQWFTDNETRLTAEFPKHYRGLETDCDKVLNGIQTAAKVANQFPYASIPEEVISSICDNNGSIQYAAEVRRLADQLKENTVYECFNTLQTLGLISDRNDEVSFAENILVKARKCLEQEMACHEIISQIDAAKKEGCLTLDILNELISDASVIRQECTWFKENIPDIASELDIMTSAKDEPIRQEITDAKLILKNHDAIAERDETEELTALFGNRYTGNFTDWQGIIQDIDLVDAFEQYGIEGLEGFIRVVSDNESKRKETEKTVQRFKELYNSTEAKFKYFDDLFPSINMKDMPLHEVSAKYEKCLDGFGELNKWLDYVETKADCNKQGLSSFTYEIVLQNNTVNDIRRAFERGFYSQWLELAVNDVPSVQTFRRRVHEQRLGKFINLDEKQFELSRARIRDSIISKFPNPNAVMNARSELRILLHEMEKKRRFMPLRKLFHEIPNLLLTLKPCLMMSPLSVAYFLNAEDYHFDMVIFDEASQILPQDAIGAIFRADQTIIAGDTRQLPPTNFFSANTSNGNDDYDEINEEDYEDEIYDSILEETKNVLPNRTLLWHYRSKHEHLIAFSNQEIYRNELITFPSSNESQPDTGVEFVFVEDGYYESGGKNCNVLEAKQCVQLVKEHIEKHPDRSLGIIAFSEKQQQAISLELQRFREQNPKYEFFFVEDKEDEFFVKNLENVQGDERDTIFFSIGYAKTKEQKATGKPMSMRFGPLGVSGGERRLNVAITRAKINVKLVSSIIPSDIDLSKTESEGVRMLRNYIEFAMNSNATLSSAHQSRMPDDFVSAIYKFICDRGYNARQYVGCSRYRVDIAIEHPEIQNEFVAGIECDGMSYVSAKTARDRDRLRGFVLNNMGWNMYRVWSAEWYKNTEVEGQKLLDFINISIEKSNDRLKFVREQKEAEENKLHVGTEKERIKKEQEEEKHLPKEQKLDEDNRYTIEHEVKERDGKDEIRRQVEKKEKNPGNHSRENIYEELVSMGFTCIDNRASSSIIWVLYNIDQKEQFEQIAAKYQAQYKLEKRGAMATGGKAAWRIMT